jgi:hypothetical protein
MSEKTAAATSLPIKYTSVFNGEYIWISLPVHLRGGGGDDDSGNDADDERDHSRDDDDSDDDGPYNGRRPHYDPNDHFNESDADEDR